MEPGNKAGNAQVRTKLHLLRHAEEIRTVVDAIAIFKAEYDSALRSGAWEDLYRAQGGWSSLDRLETWIKTPSPVSSIDQ